MLPRNFKGAEHRKSVLPNLQFGSSEEIAKENEEKLKKKYPTT